MNLLVVSDEVPDPRRSAGDMRLFELLLMFRELGHEVLLLTMHPLHEQTEERATALLIRGIRCGFFPDGLKTENGSCTFDAAVTSTYWIFLNSAPQIRQACPDCPIILDTVDLHALRLRRSLRLHMGWRRLISTLRVRRDEGNAIASADAVWFVSDTERQRAGVGLTRGSVVTTVHRKEANPPGFGGRNGLIFLGAYTHEPNVDAARYLIRRLLPRLRRLEPGLRVTLAGASPPAEIKRLAARHGVETTGFVQDHRQLLKTHRVGIAPLRYGAGVKGKIGEYLACGLPSVATATAVEGMELSHEKEILVANRAGDMAAQIVRLHRDEALWTRLSSAGRALCQARFGTATVRAQVRAALNAAMQMIGGRKALK